MCLFWFTCFRNSQDPVSIYYMLGIVLNTIHTLRGLIFTIPQIGRYRQGYIINSYFTDEETEAQGYKVLCTTKKKVPVKSCVSMWTISFFFLCLLYALHQLLSAALGSCVTKGPRPLVGGQYLGRGGFPSPTGPSMHLNPRALYMGQMIRVT